ncbi:hypothetical protein [Parvularcula marina]|uniref:hypothetical protein n=1 Tax=Parvularcula marina TaxID=2292771 RepID=UPI003516F71E
MKRILFGALGAITLLGASAVAQSNSIGSSSQPSGPVQVHEATSLTQMKSLMSANGLAASQIQGPSGQMLLVSTPQGGQFFLNPRGCADPANQTGCKMVELAVPFQGAPASTEAVNNFHISASRLAFALTGSDGTVVAYKLYYPGGITDDHFLFLLTGFLLDVESFASKYSGASGQLVSIEEEAFPPLAKTVAMSASDLSPYAPYFAVETKNGPETKFLGGTLDDIAEQFGN